MEKRLKSLMTFLDGAHSKYHAVAQIADLLEKSGYRCLAESAQWELKPGGKYYLTRGGSALVAFRAPSEKPSGFLVSASHSDHPLFKVKENGELTGKYTRLATETYGSLIIATWLDRPLSVAGRVFIQTEQGIESRLVDIDRDLLMIPNIAIHMNRKINESCPWNPAVDTLALLGSESASGKLEALLEEAAGGRIVGRDLNLYIRQKASVWGVDEEYFSSASIDDLECAWCCTQGFLEAKESQAVPVLCIFDSEEAGSASAQGAAGRLLDSVLNRICAGLQLDLHQMLSQSFMVSADNGHAIHPNHPEYSDAANAPVLNGGVVLKFNAAQKYATDGLAAAVFCRICENAKVPVQTYYNRADLPGGSTLGHISLSQVSVPTADIGLAQLAMHSAYETAGVRDAGYLVEAMKEYYGVSLKCPADGEYAIY